MEWQPIDTAPRDGAFLVKNALGQVCPCDARDGVHVVHNTPGLADWSWPERATHWQPYPDA